MSAEDVLGVRRGASDAAVKDAYRRYVRRHHPDAGGDAHALERGIDAYRTLARRGAVASQNVTFYEKGGRRKRFRRLLLHASCAIRDRSRRS